MTPPDPTPDLKRIASAVEGVVIVLFLIFLSSCMNCVRH